jgi:hypothetical protein
MKVLTKTFFTFLQVYPVAGSAIFPAPRPEKMMTGDSKGQKLEIRGNWDFKILAIWVEHWLRVAYHKEGNPINTSHATVFLKGLSCGSV